MLLHYFDPVGCDEWDLCARPLIRAGMPVLIDEDLRFEDEHRRRVTVRRPDFPEQSVPTWQQVQPSEYEPWDQVRDGPRHVIDMTATERGVAVALERLGVADHQSNKPTH